MAIEQASQLTAAPLPKLDLPSKEQLDCEAQNGTWDAATKTCKLPLSTPEEAPVVDPDNPETFDIQGTGKQGVRLPDGREYFGLTPDEIEVITSGEAKRNRQPLGTEPAGSAQARADASFKLQQSINKIGDIGQLSTVEQANINWSQAITAGIAGVVPAAAGGAAVGATAGLLGGPLAPVTSSAGAVALGAAAAINGFVRGVLANVEEQQRGELGAADIELTNSRTLMRLFAMLASQDPSNADFWIEKYNAQLTRAYQSRRHTHAEVQGDLNAFMEDGREQLADFDSFLKDGGIASIYGEKLRLALESGVPLSIIEEDLI